MRQSSHVSKYNIDCPEGRTVFLTLLREVTYDGDNYKWGFQIKDSEKRHQWFKLALDPSQIHDSGLASEYMDPRAYPPPYDVEKLVTDFLTGLREQTARVLHYKIPESALLSTPIEYIVCSWRNRANV